MSKSQRVTNLAGHMFRPYYQYIMKVNLYKSPIDVKGNSRLTHMHKRFQGLNKKYAQPDLRVRLVDNADTANSYFTIEYKNGWINTYAFQDMTMNEIHQSLEDYGEYVHDDMCNKQEDEDYELTAVRY